MKKNCLFVSYYFPNKEQAHFGDFWARGGYLVLKSTTNCVSMGPWDQINEFPK